MTIRCRHADSQNAGRGCLLPCRFALGISELAQCHPALLEVAPSLVRQPNLPRSPDKQPDIEAFFKARHRTADSRRCHASCGGSGRETLQLSCQTEQFDTAQKEVFKLTLHSLSMTLDYCFSQRNYIVVASDPPANNPVNQLHHHALATHSDAAHFAVGMANSAPFSMLSGQRCMMDFCFV